MIRQKLGGWGMSSEWAEVRLEGITSTLGDGLHGTPEYDDHGDYHFINGNNLSNGRLIVNEKTRRVSESEFLKYRKNLNDRTILVSINGTLGNVALYRGEKVILGKSACYFNVREDIDKHFVRYVLESDVFQNYIHNLATGSTIKNVSLRLMRDFSFRIPSLVEQEQISSILVALDDRIALLRETNATLEAIAQALFKSWFVDFDPVHAKQQGIAPEGLDEATAALFPDSFEESALGLVPRGWRVSNFGDCINRLSVGKKYDQKTASQEGDVPILDQGKSGIIGFHNDVPGVVATLDDPVVVFANHTCYMRLITFPFSAIQNVLPFKGKGVDTVWVYYATKERVKFSEYKGHWPDFSIEKTIMPDTKLTMIFRDTVDPLIRQIRFNELQSQTLATLRDTLLPRLISGQLRLPEAEALLEEV